jgi:tRNA1(Val) A37 N6-methylase TrmN6
LDLGTGNGILLLMMAKDFRDKYYVGIEIIKELCDIAVINFERMSEYLKCGLNYRILNADYAKLDDVLIDEQFDLIVSNPPYYTKGTGRMSTDNIKATARFELTANLMQLLQSVKSYLKYDGKSFIIFPLNRSGEFMAVCRRIGLAINSKEYIDYQTKSFHTDLEKVNSKTKVIYEVVHA